jgi:signal transduction histidine kinase
VGADAAGDQPAPEHLDLLTVASHELRTPLTSVKAALNLLNHDDEPMSPRAKRLLRIAEVETDRLIRLTTEILDSARNDARELPINCDWVSLTDVITRSCDGLSGLAEQSKVQLQFDRSAQFEIYADPTRMEQVLTNILANAIRFSPERGTVFVAAQPDAFAHMVIEIKDEGPGIEASRQPSVFQKFKQAGAPSAIGSGLGLSITKTLVERMGGSLGVRSNAGAGSVFYISLRDWRKAVRVRVAA